MEPKHVLVIRSSALGDVAMTVPVLKQLLQRYPEIRLTVVTSPAFAPLFESLERTEVHALEKQGKHKGLPGIYKLFRQLKAMHHYDAVADLHNVLRSTVLRNLFWLAGVPTAKIDKGRKEKKELTRKEYKKLRQLKTSFERYAEVFRQLGFSFSLDTQQTVYPKQVLPSSAAEVFIHGRKHIGIAPFAKHREKMYPSDKMLAVIQQLHSDPQNQLFFLGGGKEEINLLKQWEAQFPGARSLAGKFSFREELAVISNLDVMISMDSANMHLASLFGVPVVSAWGATHPYAGFYGWGQNPANIAQLDLYCRPCSVFGNKPCYRGDHACMQQLPEAMIVEKLKSTSAADHSST